MESSMKSIRHYQQSLGTAAFFMGDAPDVDINNVLMALDSKPGWHEGGDLDLGDDDIVDIIASIDDMMTS